MIIIDQWYKSHVEDFNGSIKEEETSDGQYEVSVSNKVIAKVPDKNTADILLARVEHFVTYYRRKIDTFDTYKELQIIKNNPTISLDNSGFGSYFS